MSRKRRKKALDEKHEQLIRLLKFVVKFSLLAIPVWLILIFNMQVPVLKDITAAIVYWVIKGLSINAMLSGTTITIPTIDGVFAVNLNWVCVGWESMYIFFALVFATDFVIRKKIRGMVLLPLIYAVNITRIVSTLVLVSSYGSGLFDILHNTWTFIFAAILLFLWWVWLKFI